MKKLCAISLLLCALGSSAFAASKTQTVKTSVASGTTIAPTLAATGSGSLLVASLVIELNAPAPACTSFVTASGSGQLVATGKRQWLFYRENTPSGVTSVSCSWTGSAKGEIVVDEWAGMETSGALDVSAGTAPASSATPSCATTVATNVKNDVVFIAWGINNAPTVTAGAGFAVSDTQGNTTSTASIETKTVAAYGTQTGGVTLGTAQTTACVVAAFKIATAATTPAGANTGGTGADDATLGTRAWTSPTNAQVSDNVYATNVGAAGDLNVISHYLKVTNFGFAIPSGAQIVGVKVEIEEKSVLVETGTVCPGSSQLSDSTLKLVISGAISGNNRGATASIWPTVEAFVSYGGTNDMWGVDSADTDWNASTSGIVLSTAHTGCTDAEPSQSRQTASVDSVRITISYISTAVPKRRVIIMSQTRTGRLYEQGGQ
jgi:hypothetical protein